MPKKNSPPATTHLTEEELDARSLAKCRETRINPPTVFYQVGDKVGFGGFKTSIVTDVIDNGKIYRLLCKPATGPYGVPYEGCGEARYVAWHDIFLQGGYTKFVSDWKVNVDYQSADLSSLLFYYYKSGGIDMDPPYQRDLVWSFEDKHALIDSIFQKIDIGKFTLVRLEWDEIDARRTKGDGHEYHSEILDGKQRLSTIIEFFEGRFAYKGKTIHELSSMDFLHFTHYKVNLGWASNLSKAERLQFFIRLNTGGVTQSQEHINAVKDMLDQLKS